MKRIVVTSGEPAGIGPDLMAMIARAPWAARISILGDRTLIESRAASRKLSLDGLLIEHVPLLAPAIAGQLNPANARYVLNLLERAVQGCVHGAYAAMVTAPVHKGVINDAAIPGLNFTGHTEYLADKTGTPRVVMMLVGAGMRVALATTHLALKDVPAALTQDSLEKTLGILVADLKAKFGIAQPRILVAGLNPHAGEGGYLGREEIDVIAPVIARLRTKGFDLIGPLPADTLFTPRQLEHADARHVGRQVRADAGDGERLRLFGHHGDDRGRAARIAIMQIGGDSLDPPQVGLGHGAGRPEIRRT